MISCWALCLDKVILVSGWLLGEPSSLITNWAWQIAAENGKHVGSVAIPNTLLVFVHARQTVAATTMHQQGAGVQSLAVSEA